MYTAGRGVGRGGGRMPNVYKFKYTRSNAGGYSSSTDCGSISQPTLCKRSPLKIHVIQATTGEGIHTCSSSRNPIFSPYAGQTRICSPCCNNAPPTPTLEEDHRINPHVGGGSPYSRNLGLFIYKNENSEHLVASLSQSLEDHLLSSRPTFTTNI